MDQEKVRTDFVDRRGRDALQLAIANGHLECVQWLVDLGHVPVDQKAVTLAFQKHKAGVERYLRESILEEGISNYLRELNLEEGMPHSKNEHASGLKVDFSTRLQ